MLDEPTYFRVCSTCRKEIGFEAPWFRCSVSTCNRSRLPLFFCSVDCFTAHVPILRHRDAWAEPQRAPSKQACMLQLEEERTASERESKDAVAPHAEVQDADLPHDVLVVVSKLKAYVRARSGFNTAENVAEALSDHLRELCKEAIRNAGQDGRKTLMDRDFRTLLR